MAVTRTNVNSLVTHTCQELQTLKSKIGEDVSNVNDEDIKAILSSLQHDTNLLAKEAHQQREISHLDPKLKKDLKTLIFQIQHSPAFSQVIGAHQSQLLGVFRKIETSIAKFESKVEKIDPMM